MSNRTIAIGAIGVTPPEEKLRVRIAGLSVETTMFWITIGAMFMLGVILLLTWIDQQK